MIFWYPFFSITPRETNGGFEEIAKKVKSPYSCRFDKFGNVLLKCFFIIPLVKASCCFRWKTVGAIIYSFLLPFLIGQDFKKHSGQIKGSVSFSALREMSHKITEFFWQKKMIRSEKSSRYIVIYQKKR